MAKVLLNLQETTSPAASFPAGLDVRFFRTPAETWEAMYADCVMAKFSIKFEQYIIENDEVGQRFMRLFVEKAQAGVKISLILDSLGSSAMRSSPLTTAVRQAGGEVVFYNPVRFAHLFSPAKLFPRNHAKSLLIDDRLAYVGGVCLAGHMRDWQDMQVRFTGDTTKDMLEDFDRFRHSVAQFDKPSPMPPPPPRHSFPFRYVVHRPYQGINEIYRELLLGINQASREINLATPYFLPPRRLRAALRAASRRGVKVSVLMSARSDVLLADCVGRSYLSRFLNNGIRVLYYQPAVMHAKYAFIDDDWATIGSTNFDYISLKSNRETNLLTDNPGLVAELRQYFKADAENCRLATMADWSAQPLYYKLLGYAARPFRRFM